MKYNRSSSFIYKKEFCRLYRHSAQCTALKEKHSKCQALERTAPTGAKKERKHQKRKEIKKRKK